MKNARARIFAQTGRNGLDIYLDINGVRHYLVTRRQDIYIWKKLKDGRCLGELRRIKPTRSKGGQKYQHYVKQVLEVADSYMKYELAV